MVSHSYGSKSYLHKGSTASNGENLISFRQSSKSRWNFNLIYLRFIQSACLVNIDADAESDSESISRDFETSLNVRSIDKASR